MWRGPLRSCSFFRACARPGLSRKNLNYWQAFPAAASPTLARHQQYVLRSAAAIETIIHTSQACGGLMWSQMNQLPPTA